MALIISGCLINHVTSQVRDQGCDRHALLFRREVRSCSMMMITSVDSDPAAAPSPTPPRLTTQRVQGEAHVMMQRRCREMEEGKFVGPDDDDKC